MTFWTKIWQTSRCEVIKLIYNTFSPVCSMFKLFVCLRVCGFFWFFYFILLYRTHPSMHAPLQCKHHCTAANPPHPHVILERRQTHTYTHSPTQNMAIFTLGIVYVKWPSLVPVFPGSVYKMVYRTYFTKLKTPSSITKPDCFHCNPVIIIVNPFLSIAVLTFLMKTSA